jgi:hypothetical protein
MGARYALMWMPLEEAPIDAAALRACVCDSGINMRFHFKELSLASVILLYVLSMPTLLRAGPDPWNILQDFAPVEGIKTQIDKHFVAALYHNGKENLFALVLFLADCDPKTCVLRNRVAYSVFNPQGIRIGEYVDPRLQELLVFAVAEKYPI